MTFSVPPSLPNFPVSRPRRARRTPWLRKMLAEHTLCAADLIWPVFVIEGSNEREAIPSMPGVDRLSIDLLVKAAREAADVGIPALALFPKTEQGLKDESGSEALNPDNLINRAVREVKAAVPNIGIVCDVALDPYTSHGHDGVLDTSGYVDNDASVERLVSQALEQARAGADIIAPSDMMDGRIGAIRSVLESEGFGTVCLMSYTAKYASAFYGPFRDAVGAGALNGGDKKTYQMSPTNTQEALREASLDIAEGADMLMVKPGLPYLDIVRRLVDTFALPTFAYHVSGEYAMLHAAAQNGWIDKDKAVFESLMAFKRAGCSGILTYCALDVARTLSDKA